MCYSATVQLITSAIILICCAFYYYEYSKGPHQKKWQKPFLKLTIIAFICVGLHQFFEFLSLITGSELIYKTGLVISVCSPYFLIRSLEELSNEKFHSQITLGLISLLAIIIFSSPMSFAAKSFHLIHNSAGLWSFAWMLLFIYWNICAIRVYRETDDDCKGKILLYLFAIANISFILSTLYTLGSYFVYSINVCAEAPSIWCTFFVIQTLFLPIFLNKIGKYHRNTTTRIVSLKTSLFYFLMAALILILLIAIAPFFDCLSWKFVFP